MCVAPACAAGEAAHKYSLWAPRITQLGNKSRELNVFQSSSTWLLSPSEAATRKGFFPLYSPFTLERANPQSSPPERPCTSWSHPRDSGNVANGWQSSGPGGSAGIWRGKESELVGKMLGDFIPCRFSHGSVIVPTIFSRALISVLLSFTPLLFHHYSARFLCIPIGNKFLYYTFFDLGMFVTLAIVRGGKGGLLGIIALFVLYL